MRLTSEFTCKVDTYYFDEETAKRFMNSQVKKEEEKVMERNYKLGDKFVVEIAEVMRSVTGPADNVLYKMKGFNSLVFDKRGLDNLAKQSEGFIEYSQYAKLKRAFEEYRKETSAQIAQLEEKNMCYMEISSQDAIRIHDTKEEIRKLKEDIKNLANGASAYLTEKEELDKQVKALNCSNRHYILAVKELKKQLAKELDLNDKGVNYIALLEEQVRRLDEDNTGLRLMKDDLEKYADKLANEKTELLNEICRLKSCCDNYRNDNHTLTEKIEELDAENSYLTDDNASKEERIYELIKKINELTEAGDSLAYKNRRLTGANKALDEAKCEAWRMHYDDVNRIDALTAQIKDLEEENAHLTDELTKANEKAKGYYRELNRTKNDATYWMKKSLEVEK